MSNGNPPPSTTPATPEVQPGAYIPTDEVPDVPPLKPSKYPLSSAPLPEGVTKETIQKQTPAISNPDASAAAAPNAPPPAPAPAPAPAPTTP
jgi:hypothetical protein